MTKYKSLVTIITQPIEGELNKQRFEKIMMAFYPELWPLYEAIRFYDIDTEFLTTLIRCIANLTSESGWGRVSIYIANKKITAVKPELSFTFDNFVFNKDKVDKDKK